MRIFGLDIHRTFAEVMVLEDGQVTSLGRVLLDRNHLIKFADTLTPEEILLSIRHLRSLKGRPSRPVYPPRHLPPAAQDPDR